MDNEDEFPVLPDYSVDGLEFLVLVAKWFTKILLKS